MYWKRSFLVRISDGYFQPKADVQQVIESHLTETVKISHWRTNDWSEYRSASLAVVQCLVIYGLLG